REGLDMPEVALVAILDADKEGFLRSERSLIQTIGRAARNIAGRAVLYADKITDSMQRAMSEIDRRRNIQINYNTEHNITPKGIHKPIDSVMYKADAPTDLVNTARHIKPDLSTLSTEELSTKIKQTRKQMRRAAQELDFEKAATLRDEILQLQELLKVSV
ncbi:UvrB/UvrC motif-containing protein, partial [Gammaproteobacteria bacterium]|nr:UvrB/UvrC motif-containing protein [Gammaproteobacteria bacterium]